ncbi:MAG: acetate--CoA ligase family protein [Armatimonadota bacterium]|nr:acetate--CoA ligase family protein [Armatimonadota bacterium]
MPAVPFRDLSPLLNPKAVAVVGASERHGTAGRLVLENLRALRFSGAVYAVHPSHRDVLGFPCYPHLKALPGPVDTVAVLLAADKVLATLEAAVGVGAKSAWVLASGFAESGAEGAARQRELARFAADTGLVVCGPNCIGVANLVDGVATYSVALSPATKAGGVSAVVQSGAICLGLANAGRLGFRYLISSGNEAVLDSADYIGFLAGDPQTRLIVAFLEGIRSPARFVEAARAAALANKPILVVKVGRTEASRRAVQAHTGSLAGADAVCDAVFRRHGIQRLDTIDELIEAADLFSTCPLPAGDGIGLLSLSGGQIGLVADLAQDLGLTFPSLSDVTRRGLETILPPYTRIENPLDAWGSGDLERTYPACVNLVVRDDRIHLLAVTRDTPPWVAERELEQSIAVANAAVAAARDTRKPVVMFSNISAGVHPALTRVLGAGGVPHLQGIRETLRAMQAFTRYAGFRHRMGMPVSRGRPSPDDLPLWRSRLSGVRGTLTEPDGRRLLAAYGIPGPRERVATSADEAVTAARELGYPVALKILSAGIAHKTDIGGVRLNLRSDADVHRAFHDVMRAARTHHPATTLDGVLVQDMVTTPSVEVILGILRDPDFGPVVVFGTGGILTEVLADSALRIPPLSRDEAVEMIGETRAARLLRGVRDHPAADADALADALVSLSQLAVDLGDLIAALDINPVMVLPAGQGVCAVDALVEIERQP